MYFRQIRILYSGIYAKRLIVAKQSLRPRCFFEDTEGKAKETEQHSILLDAVKHSAICIFPLKLGNHKEARPIGPARFLRRPTAERLMFQGGCQIRFQTQPRPSAITHHPDAFARGIEIERRHGAGLSRYCGKFS
jgi:hypothetical protein